MYVFLFLLQVEIAMLFFCITACLFQATLENPVDLAFGAFWCKKSSLAPSVVVNH